MANTLDVSGNTAVSWSLSDDTGSSKSNTQRTTRTITSGTGPGQANVAWSETFATTGVGSATWPVTQLPVSAFGFVGRGSVTTMKEVLVSVTTGPTGGYMTFGAPTGVTGVRINVGASFHMADYLVGIPMATGSFSLVNGATGTYAGQITVVGNGTYGPTA